MTGTLTHKLIADHLVEGSMTPGEEIGIRVDQTLTQDATGTMVMLELEAMELDRVMTEVSAQYVDHNLIQEDSKNPDDHRFLLSACRRFGIWFSQAGNGVSHPRHMERLGVPGKTLLGSDSHTPAAGSLGMLAIGAGGLEVAMAMAGEPFYFPMPEVWGVRLVGELPQWVSAKDVILEMLRRHGVRGGIGRIVEYHGPGLSSLSAMDRHVIANMGAELGATTTVFPSDEKVREFLVGQRREGDWVDLRADEDASYDEDEEIDLSALEPLIAMPTSPGNVERVTEVAGEKIHQAYIGSSANPGYRDFAIAAEMVRGRRVPADVSFDINPTSRQILLNLIADGHILSLVEAGARLHQAGCNGCIGMGQAPATDTISLRTVPRNFPGRSGAAEDRVCLVSPETATASALTGGITDPRSLGLEYPRIDPPSRPIIDDDLFVPPLPPDEGRRVALVKGPNIKSIPHFEPLPDQLTLPVLLRVGDDISTDEIMPAGARVLPYRSNVERISQFVFEIIDDSYPKRAMEVRETGGHAVVGGSNYGQGSSREHAALAPRHLGLRIVLARDFARIHFQNLVNFGVLPLVFDDPDDWARLDQADVIHIDGIRRLLDVGAGTTLVRTTGEEIGVRHQLSPRQAEIVATGGLINLMRQRLQA